MSIFGVDVPQERKEQIMAYLDTYGCQPSQRGYQYFVGLISLYADNTDWNCDTLLSEYSEIVLGCGDKYNKQKIYRACRYTLLTSKGGGNYTPYGFIKTGVMSL